MIKVLNIISDTNIGGAGRVLENYLRYMDRDNFEAAVALPRGSLLIERLKPFGVPIYELDGIADTSMDLSAVKKLKKLIREVNPDIVHTHGAMSGRIAGRQCGKKVVFTRHSAFPLPEKLNKQPLKGIYKLVNEHYADRIICVSPICRDYLMEGGVSCDNIDVVINGVDAATRSGEADCVALRRNFGIEDGVFTAAVIARIEHYKGHMYVAEAAKILKDRGRNFRIIAAGTGSYEDEVKSRARDLGVEDVLLFPGFVSDVPGLLSILDVQINASYNEAASLSILEGLSMGVPAIVSDFPGNLSIVDDGKTGLVFKTRDPVGLADAIERLMDDRNLLAKLGENARTEYEKRFTGAIFAKNTEKVYLKVTEGGHHGK
ncbi:MAG: glycosyltransferase [Oscillospiraceae bacterium]